MTTIVTTPASAGRPVGLHDPVRLRDVLVAPYTDLGEGTGVFAHRGGPVWPSWDDQTVARHRRGGQPVDARPLPCEPERRIAAPLWWVGPVVPQLGRQVADFSMRIMATLAADPDATLAIATDPSGHQRWDDALRTFHEILAWFGLIPERVWVIDRPALVERLAVVGQAEQVGGPGPVADHLDRMDELVARRLGTPIRAGTIYVASAAAGEPVRYAGERAVEEALKSAGARVVRPGQISLADQLAASAGADSLILAGSDAVHATQLLGRGLGSVLVVAPSDDQAVPIGEASLRPRARTLAHLNPLAGMVRAQAPEGPMTQIVGLPVIDPERLIGQLEDAVPGLTARWDRLAFEDARDADILEWIERRRRHPLLRRADAQASLIESLAAAGVGYLSATVRGLLTPARRETVSIAAGRSTERRLLPHASVVRRLQRIAAAIGATSYLELGPHAGVTLDSVPVVKRTAVGPDLVPLEGDPERGIIRLRSHADEFLAAIAPETSFDLVYLSGGSSFATAYRLLCGSLLHTHASSIIVIDATDPQGADTTIPEEPRARWQPGADAGPWYGDSCKVVLAIHDLHPGLDYATVGEPGDRQTLVWRGRGSARPPLFGSIDRIGRVGYLNLIERDDLPRPAHIDDVMVRWRDESMRNAA